MSEEWPREMHLLHPHVNTFGQMIDMPERRKYILATPEALAASPEVQALIAAAILDAQLRVLERGRIDTPDEVRAAAIRKSGDE